MKDHSTLDNRLDRLRTRALFVGLFFSAVTVAGAFTSPSQFYRSYLLGYLFWAGLGLGCTALLMLHHLVEGSWGAVIQRLLEAGSRTLPFMVLFFVPLLLGMGELYVWARPDEVAASPLLQHKQPYLNVPFFLGRALFYFATWSVLVFFLNRWSRERELKVRDDEASQRRLEGLSGPGLVLFGLTASFAVIDWVMSLEPLWFSTVYGVLFMVGYGLATLALVILVLALLSRYEPLAGVAKAGHFHDLGNLMLAFVMLWAYLSFSQFLIIWSANIAEEVPWYIRRTHGGWEFLAVFLMIFHFALPFLVLLNRIAKRRIRNLMWIAGGILLVRFADLLWLVVPSFHPQQIRVHWMDLAAPAGIGGLWLALFLWQLKGRSLLPDFARQLAESAHHHE